jgi:hypothetical protein
VSADRIAVGHTRDAAKKVVTEPASSVFYRQPLRLGVGADVDRLDDDWEADTGGEVATKLLVARGRAAKAMVQVCEGNDAEALLLGEFLEQQG